MLPSLGLVTAEMFQSKEDSDVMSKMVEDVDEVSSDSVSYISYFHVLCITPGKTNGITTQSCRVKLWTGLCKTS